MAEYDEDDRDDEPHSRPRSGGSNKTLWIVLGVVGGVLILGMVACGGLFFLGYRAAKDMVGTFGIATGAAESFLSQLQANQPDAAYRSTSQNFRATQSREQFGKLLAQYPMLAGHTTRTANSFNMFQVNGVTKFRTQYTLTGPNNATTCTLILVEENGTWVVDSLTVP